MAGELEPDAAPASSSRWGSNLFHLGILFLLFGHAVGLLTPKAVYTLFITVEQKQLLAVVAGGIAGVVCFVGLTLLLHRRLFDARIRRDQHLHGSHGADPSCGSSSTLGLITLPFSLVAFGRIGDADPGALGAGHPDAAAGRSQGRCRRLPWPYLTHLVLGMTIFLIFPFSRLVHIWSAPVWYLGRRGYQVVRTRRDLSAGGGRTPSRQPAE